MRSKGKPLSSCDSMTSIHSACESSLTPSLLFWSYSMTVMPSTSLCMITTVEAAASQHPYAALEGSLPFSWTKNAFVIMFIWLLKLRKR